MSNNRRRSAEKLLNNETSPSTRVNDINVNTPSPSSVGSSSTIENSSNERPAAFRMKILRENSSIFKRRHRNDRSIHSANHQYIIAMTNILFQMQKEMYKLKRRTRHVEHALQQQIRCTNPIIRIPRLTRDDLRVSTVNESQPEHCHEIYDENEKSMTNVDEQKSKLSDEKSKTTSETTEENLNATQSDQSIVGSDAESEGFQLPVNPWDVGEGRLRSRPVVVRPAKAPRKKVKCEICNKFYDATNIEKHKSRSHRQPSPMRTEEAIAPEIDVLPSVPLPDAIGSLSQLIVPSPNRNESPSIFTIADMEHDDIPIQFSTESTKTIVFATTFTDRQQKDVIEQFLRKFPNSVRQCQSIDRETTHLIVNDEKTRLRSPLTLRLIEAIAHHCFCISFNWIYDCLKYDRLVDETLFEILGDDTESQAHGGPQRSRLALPNEKLFDKFAFMIKCTENGENSISNDQLRHLIGISGGTMIDYITQATRNQYNIIVLCDGLFVSQRRTNYQQCQRLNIRFLSPNWVIRSILEYRIKSFEGFEETPT